MEITCMKKKINYIDRAFEYFMNRFRLIEPVPKLEFEQLTGLSINSIQKEIEWGLKQKYIEDNEHYWQVTEQGKLFLNDLLEIFLPD